MNAKELFAKLCEYAPIELSDKLVQIENGYDNSGIILDCDLDAKKILFCLDLTHESVDYAIGKECGIIVTHHPAIYSPIKRLNEQDPILRCAISGISVISMHLNLDCAKEGIDHCLSKGLGGEDITILTKLGEEVGYGRVATVNATAGEIFERYKSEFATEKAWFFGDKNQKITKIASFCGSGFGFKELEETLRAGAQMVVSADIPHHVLKEAIEKGLCVLSCTHYSTENYGMKKFFEFFEKELKEKIYFFDDERFV